ncbi:MAG: LamG-like jellyroll fold domain-containing protein [Akkermansiaceae bacterium]
MKTKQYVTLIAASLGLAATSQAALTTGLVGYYDGSTLNNHAAASDGDAVTSSGVGVNVAGGQVGTAYEFDGTGADTFTVLTSYGSGATDLGETFTVAAWYQVSSTADPSGNSGDRMFVWENASDHDFSYWIDEDGGGNNGGNINGNGAMYVDDTTVNFAHVHTFGGSWDHVAQTIVTSGANTTVTTFINGSNVGSLTRATADFGNPGLQAGLIDTGINFGRARTPSSDRPFDGLIDEIAIWDRELTSTEITEAFNRGNAGLAVVPEPSSTALLGLGGLALILRRRK